MRAGAQIDALDQRRVRAGAGRDHIGCARRHVEIGRRFRLDAFAAQTRSQGRGAFRRAIPNDDAAERWPRGAVRAHEKRRHRAGADDE